MKKIIFLKPVGSMKEPGEVYIRGLFGVPQAWENKHKTDDNDWWWQEDTRPEDCRFFHHNTIKYCLKEKKIKILK